MPTIARSSPHSSPTSHGPDSVAVVLFDDGAPRQLLPFDGEAWLHPWVLGDRRADDVFAEVREAVEWESRSIILFGKETPQPRLAAWYGDESYTYSNLTLEARPMPPVLEEIRRVCETLSDATFNSVLANLYRDGNDSMGAHADDERELGPDPVIASLTLGALRTFRMRHRATGEKVELNLEPGSLLVMRGAMQHFWTHEIPKTRRPVGERINLTYRLILRNLR